MRFPLRLGPAFVLASMVSFVHASASHADDMTASNSAPAAIDANWHQGGTLHKASAREWLAATTQNQLATASDWVLSSKEQKARLAAAGGDMSQVLHSADRLRQCVNSALRRHSELYASMPAADIAVTCMITLKL